MKPTARLGSLVFASFLEQALNFLSQEGDAAWGVCLLYCTLFVSSSCSSGSIRMQFAEKQHDTESLRVCRSAENMFIELLSIFGGFWLESKRAISVDTIHPMDVHLRASRGWHIHFWRKPRSSSDSGFVCRGNFPGNHTGTSWYKYNWLWLCSCIYDGGKCINILPLMLCWARQLRIHLMSFSSLRPGGVRLTPTTCECEGLRS